MQRLKTRSQFQAVLAGLTVARTTHFALHCTGSEVSASAHSVVPDVWMGAMVPKRWAKRAVTRNAIKRQIYSVSTDFESILPGAAQVVRLRAGFDRTQFVSATSKALQTVVRHELQQLFERALARSAVASLQDGTA